MILLDERKAGPEWKTHKPPNPFSTPQQAHKSCMIFWVWCTFQGSALMLNIKVVTSIAHLCMEDGSNETKVLNLDAIGARCIG